MVSELPDVAAVFRALADPTRRAILEMLREGESSVQEIATQFPMSRPAISKHLRILREAALVVERREGRQRIYEMSAAPLAEVESWLVPFARVGRAAPRQPAARPERRPRRPAPPPPADDWRVW